MATALAQLEGATISELENPRHYNIRWLGAPMGEEGRSFLEAIQQAMIGQDDMGALGQPQIVEIDPGLRQLAHLLQQRVRVDDRPRAHDAARVRIEDVRRHQM